MLLLHSIFSSPGQFCINEGAGPPGARRMGPIGEIRVYLVKTIPQKQLNRRQPYLL